jgi:hypothetical protein
MERERASTSPHDRLVIAIERARLVLHDSATLIEQQHTLVAALRETVASIHQRRSGGSSD